MRYKVGYNDHARIEHERLLKVKISAFNELLAYCEQWITITDKHALTTNVCEYFKDQFQSRYFKEFSKLVSYSKRLELFDIDLGKIKSLENQFKAINIPLDLETLTPLTDYDFNIYLTDPEEIKRFQIGEKLINSLKEFEALGVPMDFFHLGLGFKLFVNYNPSKRCLIPTVR